ncbi:MAG: esterase family protein [Muribaculaceae bacterium]|nr:esterase family protein [Muribaculaceae bacterium]
MKKLLIIIAIAAIATSVVAAACCTPKTEQSSTSKSIPMVKIPFRLQVDTLLVFSDKMGREIKNSVILPEQYFTDGSRFPVVYLLHGYGGCYKDWLRVKSLPTLASELGMIIVCPDGQDSWYFDSPIDSTMQFETYITTELRQKVDSTYRTRTDRHGRAITGLSMGGHGALWLAFRHPDLYGACGSMSGGVDFTGWPRSWRLPDRLGPYEANPELWRSHTVISLVPTLKPGQLQIIIDDGDADFFYDVNMALHESLVAHGIAHKFDILPGAHSWDYWTRSVVFHLKFFNKCFKGEQPELDYHILPKVSKKEAA